MKRSQAFPSQYVSKDDVMTPVQAVIAGVTFERIKGDNGEEDKPVIRFLNNHPKPLILNNTNWMAIEDAYGDESDHWSGKPVELYFEPNVTFGNKRVGGVRIRVPQGSSIGAAINGSNGAAVNLSLEDAIQLAAREAGISRQEIIDFLRSRNLSSYSPSQHTPLIRQLIAERKAHPAGVQVGAGDHVPVGDDDIPF
jgi:hypothetical protein